MIGKHVNPSRFESSNRILYIHPKFFAVTDAEKNSFSRENDPSHSAFDTALFRRNAAIGRTPRADEILSDLSLAEREMVLRASDVMIHELSHACNLRDQEHDLSKVLA